MSIIRNGILSADLDVPVVLPTLNLDFANSQSLDSRITFSRGSIGTRVNRNGLIETIAANQPRFDFDPISGECRGLLIEESRTNLLTYSEDLDTWYKSPGGINVTQNATTSPFGQSTAELIEVISSGGSKSISKDTVTVNGTTYTASVFAKSANSRTFSMGLFTTAFIGLYNFNLTASGSVTTQVAGVSASIIPYPNGWYRCILTATTNSVGTNLLIYPNTTVNKVGDSVYLYGAQLEAGSVPTSYIPTTASTVTRSADNASMTGTNFSSWYNSIEGSLFVAARVNALGGSGYPGIAYVDDGTVNNCIGFYIEDAGSDKIGAESYISGRAQYVLLSSSATTANKLNKAISSYSINNFSGAFDTSSQIQRDTSGSIPSVNRLRIGALRGGLYPLNGTISRFTYYPKALSPSQLQYLTQ